MKTLSFFVAAVASAVCVAGAARADTLQPQANTSLCLDFSRGNAQLARCNGSSAQEFDISGNDLLRVGRSCVASQGEGSPLIATRCRDRDEYYWTFDYNGGLENGLGLCADVQSNKIREGQPVIGYSCHGKSNQRWVSNQGGGGGSTSPGGDYATAMLSPEHASNLCLDYWHDGGAMIVHTCHGGANQQFTYNYGSSTRIEVEGACLTAPSPGEQVYVRNCSNSRNQRWSLQRDGSIRSDSGYCLDVDRARRNPGTFVVLYDCTGEANQRWRER